MQFYGARVHPAADTVPVELEDRQGSKICTRKRRAAKWKSHTQRGEKTAMLAQAGTQREEQLRTTVPRA
jgi:hypothetical protein